MLAFRWCFDKRKKDSSSALCSASAQSHLFPWGSRKPNCKQSVRCRVNFVLELWAAFPSQQRNGESFAHWSSSMTGLMVITPGHVQQQTAPNLSLFPYLGQCYISVKSHLRKGAFYSPTHANNSMRASQWKALLSCAPWYFNWLAWMNTWIERCFFAEAGR